MGATPTKRYPPTRTKKINPNAVKALEDYWRKSHKTQLSKSEDIQEIRKCFNLYTLNSCGYLEKEEALCYIHDLLKISRFDKKIFKEAEKLGTDQNEYWEKYLEAIFREMDSKHTGKIYLDQLVKPHMNEWTEFLRWISVATLHEIQKENKKKKKKGKKESDEEQSDGEGQENTEEENDEKIIEDIENDDAYFTETTTKRPGGMSLGEEEVIYLRQQKVNDVCDVLQLEKPICMSLLNKYSWDVQKLLVAYAEDPEKTCETAGVKYSKSKSKKKKEKGKKIKERPKEIECSICFEDKEDYSVLESCGHEFCNDCWEESLNVQINEGKTFDINCMRQDCSELVPDDFVQKIVKPSVWEKYVKFLSKQFIETSKGVRWCSAPGCNKAIYEPTVEGDNLVGECTCGLIFCWYCKKMAHTPISCKEYAFWEEENPELGLALLNAWLFQHTKQCPKCNNSIEKNDGCFHMSCHCGFQFCWGCRKQWGTSGCSSGMCATHRETLLVDKPTHHKDEGVYGDDDERKFAFLEKVKEYFQAEEFQKARNQPILDLIEEISAKDGLFSPKIINNARHTLAQCRRIMKCMAIKQYFARSDATLKDITTQQERLGFLIEGLAQKVETDFLKDKKYDMKMLTGIQQMTNSVNVMLHNCLLSDVIVMEKEEEEVKKEDKEEKKEEKK